MKTIKEIMNPIVNNISLSVIAKSYFKRDKSWLYHKLNEDVVNNVKYKFTDDELNILTHALDDIGKRITNTSEMLKKEICKNNRIKGKYYTKVNPFSNHLFLKWLKLLPNNCTITEPFAGACDIPNFINSIEPGYKWKCFDIEPINNSVYKIVKRDTIKNFPKSKVVITNPPFLARNSATRRILNFPATKYNDLYKYCVSLMLENADYIAVIIPETFITANIFHERLFGIISLTNILFENTSFPVCLSLFVPRKKDRDFPIYIGEKCIGRYYELKKYNLEEYHEDVVNWKFNVHNGEIGIKCFDSREADICFVSGNKIETAIKHSSRAYTKVSGLPDNICPNRFIEQCNMELKDYREKTHDVFLTAFKGLRYDQQYRRRICFTTLKRIMNKVLQENYGMKP